MLLPGATGGLVGPHNGEYRRELLAAIRANPFDWVFFEYPVFRLFELRVEAAHDGARHEIRRYDDVVPVQEHRRCSAVA